MTKFVFAALAMLAFAVGTGCIASSAHAAVAYGNELNQAQGGQG